MKLSGQKDNKTISVDILELFGGKAPDCPETAMTTQEIIDASGWPSTRVNALLRNLVKSGEMAVAFRPTVTRVGYSRRIPAYYAFAKKDEV